MISKVAREMAGEIYDPVTLIKGYVDLLERKIRDGVTQHETLEPILKEIQDNCRRAVGIAESLQDLSTETLPDKLVLCGTPQIVDRAMNVFSERLKKFGIKIQVHHEKSDFKFWCQHLQIVQVLACLLNFAIERVRSRSVRGVSVATFFRIDEKARSHAVIRVQDSGPQNFETLTLENCNSVLACMGGEVELVNSSFGACLELRFPIEIK